jgi:hypothetical protein
MNIFEYIYENIKKVTKTAEIIGFYYLKFELIIKNKRNIKINCCFIEFFLYLF